MLKISRKSLIVCFVMCCVMASGMLAYAEEQWTQTASEPGARVPFTTRLAVGGRSVIVGDNQLSAATAFKILQKGGNAFDAAVGMAATMSITYPVMNDFFGGDAMIIVYSAKDKKVVTYNGSGWAPSEATIDNYIDKGGIPETGILSVEVPGSFSGWMTLLQDYGSMPLREILEPAITIAENGFPMPKIMANYTKMFYKNLNEEAKNVYGINGNPAAHRDMISNPQYAALLREIGKMKYEEAEDYFYKGPIAKEIVEFSKAQGGMLSLNDFAEFKAEKVEAHSTNYRGVDVYVCPPNSQGWALLQALNILEGYDLKSLGHNSAEYIDLLMQAMNLALQDRNHYMADPRFHKNPQMLISKEYAVARRNDMHPGEAMDGELVKGDPETFGDIYYGKSGDTTFMAVVDEMGNIVACTTSQCGAYGSGLMVPGRGFILNNRMTYFFLDKDLANFLEPRKRTMQTITPSIALKNGEPFLAFGTPGADVQEQAKLQAFLNIVEFGMDPQMAVESPRAQSRHPMGIKSHASYPRTIQVEGRVAKDVREKLEKEMHYIVQTKADWEYIGYMGMVMFAPDGKWKWAGADPRSDSIAMGW